MGFVETGNLIVLIMRSPYVGVWWAFFALIASLTIVVDVVYRRAVLKGSQYKRTPQPSTVHSQLSLMCLSYLFIFIDFAPISHETHSQAWVAVRLPLAIVFGIISLASFAGYICNCLL